MKQSMPRELKEKWIADLRAHPELQGKGRLQDEEGNFCCLGRLQVVKDGDVERDAFGFSRAYPTDVWVRDAGVQCGKVLGDFYLPSLGHRAATLDYHSCSTANDEGNFTFAQIADAIETDIEGV